MYPDECSPFCGWDGRNLRIHRLVGVALLHTAVLAGTGISAWPADFPAQAQPGDLGCQHAMSALTDLRSGLTLPRTSHREPRKQGGEFDPNLYFEAFPHLRMEKGYTLDYVYHQDGMGGYPILYARPIARPPMPPKRVPGGRGSSRLPQVRDSAEQPRGLLQFAAFVMMANQFYQDWHASYNDRQVVCSSQDVDAIIQSLEAQGSAARPMTPQQQQAARDIENPELPWSSTTPPRPSPWWFHQVGWFLPSNPHDRPSGPFDPG